MIQIGNFFFKYRNGLFIILYLALFIPSPQIFAPAVFGSYYYIWPIAIGLCTTLCGEMIRATTIGLAYIARGGKDRKVYADGLVVEGIFAHCRNPLYVGNILMLTGMGFLVNSLIYIAVFIPFFLFIYTAIVAAEENFLSGKFGSDFDLYRQKVHRWVPRLSGISTTFGTMQFNWKRWILKEYNTLYLWLNAIGLILLFRYPQLTENSAQRNTAAIVYTGLLLVVYLWVKFLKKTKRMRA